MITRNFENATFSPLQGTKSLSEARSASALGNITKLSAKSPRGTNNRYKYALLDTAQRYMPNARVATCQRVPVGYFPHGDVSNAEIGIGKAENGRMKFGGLSNCGNAWQCPCCSSTISYTRGCEVYHAMAENAKRGGQSLFLTLTQPHNSVDTLKHLVGVQGEASGKLFGNGTVKRFLKKHSYLGKIKAFEITHGQVNGWHPHLHIILLFENITILKHVKELETLIYNAWSRYIVKAGGQLPSEEHGVDLRLPRSNTYDEIAAYVAKWGMEVASHGTKRGRGKTSRTPFQILDDLHDRYCHKDHKLMLEYAEATHRKQRIHWSKGLKALFNIEDILDEELANKPPVEQRLSIKFSDFKVLRQLKLTGDLLDMAEVYSPAICKKFVDYVVLTQLAYEDAYRVSEYREKRRLRELIRYQTYQAMEEIGLVSRLL
jgi:hypothetical protein